MKKVFLEALPRRGVFVNWEKSVGHKVKFVYDDIEGELEIVKYEDLNIWVKYGDNEPYKISIASFPKGRIGHVQGIANEGHKNMGTRRIKEFEANIIKISEEYNSGNTNVLNISKKFGLSQTAVYRYLELCSERKLCKYESYRSVICLNTGKIFNHSEEASRITGISGHTIRNCCNGIGKSAGKHPTTKDRLRWMFYDEYLNQAHNDVSLFD